MSFNRYHVLAFAVVATMQQTALAQTSNYNIDAAPLSQTMAQIARKNSVSLSADPELLKDKIAPTIHGNYDIDTAFNLALAGSGLQLVKNADGTVYSLKKSEQQEQPQARDIGRLRDITVMAKGGADTNRAGQNITQLPVITVNAESEIFAGGQVARKGRLGILGDRDFMDTPFNQSNYTAELMHNQQIHHIADTLKNDATARTTNSASSGIDTFNIRGFSVNNTDLLFNGMGGVAPTFANSMMSAGVERVEVIKGPNALLNGVALQGTNIGGTINLVPKRAGDIPLNQFTVSYASDSLLGGHLDFGRRFGENNTYGVRFNTAYRGGDTTVDHQSRKSGLITLGLDYRGERLRVSTDLGYQEQDMQGTRRFVQVASGVKIPKVPDAQSNFFDPQEYSKPEVFYGAIRAEYDLADQWLVFATFGGNERKLTSWGTNRTIVDGQGNLGGTSVAIAGRADDMSARTWETGLAGNFDTLGINHKVTIAYTESNRIWKMISMPVASYGYPASNIYHPVYVNDALDFSNRPKPKTYQHITASSFALVDTLSILDEQVQLTLGARHQNIDSTIYNTNTGAISGTPYDASATTPMVGLVYKPVKNISLYINHIEGLQQGTTVSDVYSNEGETFAPYKTKQYEMGAKFDFDSIATTLSIYQIAQPSTISVNSTVTGEKPALRLNGEQRHQGVDWNIFGEVTDSVRLLGGVAYIDSELTKTQNGLNQGNQGIAVPKWRLVMGTEWDVPFIDGLTLTGRAIRNGSMYIDQANTQQIPTWSTLDIGARYRFQYANGKPIVVRTNLDNVLNKSYWEANGSQLAMGDPRTFSVSATFDF